MAQVRDKHIVYIPLFLLLSFLFFPLLDRRSGKQPAGSVQQASGITGFRDYELLPADLKAEMMQLRKQDTLQAHRYYFAYYFDTEDINYHYYVADTDLDIIRAMPVTDQAVYALLEEKFTENRDGGCVISFDARLGSGKAEAVADYVAYVLPRDYASADYRKLRVAIFKEKGVAGSSAVYQTSSTAEGDATTYRLSEVDEAPRPVRGTDYFRQVLTDEIRRQASFLYEHAEGEVLVEFTIGSKARSPQVVRGFSSVEERHEAYQADGAIIKALNSSRVRWVAGKKDGRTVDVRVAMRLAFNRQQHAVSLGISDLQEPLTKW